MAGDLIPPPSPAGRPQPDAMAGVRAPVEEPPPAEPAPPAPGEAPFRTRFGFVWGALAGVAVCVVAVTGVLAATGSDRRPPLARNWSSWKPSTSGMVAGAHDIANHVARRYRLESGNQLAAISSSEMELEGEPLGVAVRPKGSELQVLEGDGLLYVLNGLGEGGKTPGRGGRARDRLLMREALELSLFSFRYLEDVTMVAVLLPPAEKPEAKDSEVRALFYRPGDLLPQLQVPLAQTLSPTTPQPKTMTRAEAARIDSLALRNRFDFSIQPLDSDRRYLVLAEPDVVD
jgi:hypothetical protein